MKQTTKKTTLVLSLCWFMVVMSSLEAMFQDYSSLKHYVDEYKELPKSDNNDWIDPDYSSFYYQYKPGVLDKIFEYFGLKESYHWDARFFKSLLMRVSHTREKAKFELPFEQKFIVPTGSTFVIWGDLHAALHSFARCLGELKKLNIINDEFKIIQKDTYFIFLGDLISRSPYSLELFTLILVLMERNPDKVTYIRGNHERNGYWENFSMRRQLRFFARGLSDSQDAVIPMKTLINRFFNTLPDAVIIQREGSKDVVYCTHSEVPEEIIQKTDVKASIVGEKRAEVLRPRLGLEYLGFSHGTAQWSILSSPTKIYQDFFAFYYDTFVVLELAQKLEKSMLTLFSQDARQLGGFKQISYDLIFGKKVANKEEIANLHAKPEIKFGSTLPMSGNQKAFSFPTKRGIDVVVHEINSTGGIDGRYVHPYIFDDKYIPRLTRKHIDTLLHDYKIDIIVAPNGSAMLASYFDRVQAGELAVFFPVTGAPQFRKPELKNIFHIRPSYPDEARALVDYMIEEYGAKKFAFFYQNDNYGNPPLEAAHEELQKHGIANWLDVPYNRGQTNFKKESALIKAGDFDALGFFSVGSATIELLSLIGAESLVDLKLFGISDADTAVVKNYLTDTGLPFNVSLGFNMEQKNLEIIEDFNKAVDKYGLLRETNLFEGYLIAQLMIDAMRKIGPPITKERLIKWFENMKNYKFKGLTLTFNPKTRSFDMPIWIKIANGSTVEYDQKIQRINSQEKAT